MFKKKNLLREGAEADGIVLEAVYRTVSNIGLGGFSDETHEANGYRVRVQVTFDDGLTAEQSLDAKRDEIGRLYKGDTVPVRYDPSDRAKFEIDIPALLARKANVGTSALAPQSVVRMKEILAKAKADMAADQ